MDAFPAFVPLAGALVIIVGEGVPAEEKAALFTSSPATLVRRPLDADAARPQTYAGATLVFIAAPDMESGEAAGRAARSGGALLVNVVDKPTLCDFYTPAIVDRGRVVAAVGTLGAAPALAGRLKADISAVLPARLDALAAMLQAVRSDIRARIPTDFGARKAFVLSLIDGEAGAAALAGEAARAEVLAREALAEL